MCNCWYMYVCWCSSCDCEFVVVSFCLCACVGIYLHVALWWCVHVSIFISVSLCVRVCVRVWVGGSLVSLLNIKQLEVIKYLGSAGSLWILILPFPSVSQISLSFSPSFCFSFFHPSSLHPDSPSLYLSPSAATSLSLSLSNLVLWLSLTLIPVSLTLFMRESQSLNWKSALTAGTEGDGGRREELTYAILSR